MIAVLPYPGETFIQLVVACSCSRIYFFIPASALFIPKIRNGLKQSLCFVKCSTPLLTQSDEFSHRISVFRNDVIFVRKVQKARACTSIASVPGEVRSGQQLQTQAAERGDQKKPTSTQRRRRSLGRTSLATRMMI